MKIRLGLSLLAFAAIQLGAAGESAPGVRQPVQFVSQSSQISLVGYTSHELTRSAASAPSVTAKAVASPSASEVTLKEIVSANNAPTKCWLVYGTSKKSLTTTLAKSDALVGTTAVTAKVTGLKPKTTYYFRLYASNAEGTTSSSIQSVTTSDAETASVKVQSPATAGAGSSVAEATPGTNPSLTASLVR